MLRDGVAEGFSFNIPSDFTAELDETDKVSGLASQKISFNRNSSSVAEAHFLCGWTSLQTTTPALEKPSVFRCG